MKLKEKELTIALIAVGIIILSINYRYFHESSFFVFVNIITAFTVAGIPLGIKYIKYKRSRQIELIFPTFLRDITSNLKTGMTLPQAIRATGRNDYGPLNKYVKEIIAKIDWGIPFEKILQIFADVTESLTIKRTVKTITETHKSGGNIGDILDSVARSVQEIEKIKKERSARIYAQMLNGYVIFFVFLGVMLMLSRFLVPAFQEGAEANAEELTALFNQLFLRLTLIQGFFAGLSIGQMAEGSLTAGIKHVFVLMSIGYTVFTIF